MIYQLNKANVIDQDRICNEAKAKKILSKHFLGSRRKIRKTLIHHKTLCKEKLTVKVKILS